MQKTFIKVKLSKYIVSIPLPTSDSSSKEFKSKCDLYDGDASTAGYCKGWVTATNKCMRRNDWMGENCNGITPPGDGPP